MVLTQNSLRLPIGLSAFATSWTSILSKIFNAKLLIITGQLLLMAATLLLVFADSPDKYWPLVFPAFVVGSAGAILTYTHSKSVTSSISGFPVLSG
jgi:nitrate/nitrite transporter NarK